VACYRAVRGLPRHPHQARRQRRRARHRPRLARPRRARHACRCHTRRWVRVPEAVAVLVHAPPGPDRGRDRQDLAGHRRTARSPPPHRRLSGLGSRRLTGNHASPASSQPAIRLRARSRGGQESAEPITCEAEGALDDRSGGRRLACEEGGAVTVPGRLAVDSGDLRWSARRARGRPPSSLSQPSTSDDARSDALGLGLDVYGMIPVRP
jgi:hypothetical protein